MVVRVEPGPESLGACSSVTCNGGDVDRCRRLKIPVRRALKGTVSGCLNCDRGRGDRFSQEPGRPRLSQPMRRERMDQVRRVSSSALFAVSCAGDSRHRDSAKGPRLHPCRVSTSPTLTLPAMEFSDTSVA